MTLGGAGRYARGEVSRRAPLALTSISLLPSLLFSLPFLSVHYLSYLSYVCAVFFLLLSRVLSILLFYSCLYVSPLYFPSCRPYHLSYRKENANSRYTNAQKEKQDTRIKMETQAKIEKTKQNKANPQLPRPREEVINASIIIPNETSLGEWKER